MRQADVGFAVFARLHRFHVGHQVVKVHAGEGLEECGDLRGDLGHLAGDLVGAGRSVVAGGDDGDLVDLAERLGHGADDVGHVGDELVDDGGLRPLLVGFGFDVHGFGFGFALLEDDVGFGFALQPGGCGAAFGFHGDARLFGVGDVFDALTLDLGAFEDGGDELLFVTEDFGLLHFDLLLLLDLLDLDLFGDDLLLHDVGLEFVGFVGLGLLAACRFGELGFLDVEVTLGLGLFGERERFGEDALLVGGGLGHGGFS